MPSQSFLQSIASGQVTARPVFDKKAMERHARELAALNIPLDKASEIMAAIDAAAMNASRRQPGADYNANGGMLVRRLQSALSEIHGINNYTPTGFVNNTKYVD